MKNPLLVITADDFGLNEEVNRGIVEACKRGVVSSVSLLINGSAINDVLGFLRENLSLDIGIHLNILRNRPISQLEYLVDKKGYFLESVGGFLKKYCLNRQKALSEIHREFEEQIKRAVSYGIKVSHLNTEKHLHVLPAVFKIVAELAVKYGVKIVRLPFERLSFSQGIGVDKRQLLKVAITYCFYRQNRKILEENHLCPIHFHGISLSKKFSLENVAKVLGNLQEGIHELGCHPGYSSKGKMSSFDRAREEELKVLTGAGFKGFLQTGKVTLTSFTALKNKVPLLDCL